MAIIYPLRPRMTAKQVILVVTMIWIISIAVGLPFAIVAALYTYADGRIVCYSHWSEDPEKGKSIDTG